MPLARISLTLSRHFSLSFITSGRSSGLHPVSSHSCCMYVRAGRPAFTRPYVGVHRSTSLMSSSLLLQQCPACLVHLTWIVFVMGVGGRIVGALWGVAARTCSILLITFLCNCHLASSQAVLLAFKLCIHTAVSTWPLPGRNCISNQAETLLHSLEWAAAGIGLHVNAHKTEYMCFNQTGDISTLDGTFLKLVDKFTYLESSVSSTEKDIDTRLTKAWTAIDELSIIWKSDLIDIYIYIYIYICIMIYIYIYIYNDL